MDRKDLEALHRKASEHYLRGEFSEALSAWKEVLRLDPADEQALEGVRLSGQLAEGTPEPAPWAALPAADPVPQSPGMDLGDLSYLDADPLAAGGEAGAFSETVSVVEDAGLEPLRALPELGAARSAETTGGPKAWSAAEEELRRRTAELLAQAREHAASGRREDALATLDRLHVIDEDNAEARRIEEELMAGPAPSAEDPTDLWIIEAVQAIQERRFEEARGLLQRVLEVSPGHREALHYLEEIDEQLSGPAAAAGGDFPPKIDLLADTGPDPTQPAPEGLYRAGLPEITDIPVALQPRKPRRGEGPAGVGEEALAPAVPRRLGTLGNLVAWAIVIGVLAGGQWVVRRVIRVFLSGSGDAVVANGPSPEVPPAEPARTESPRPEESSRSETLTPAQTQARIEQATARARAAAASGDYASAVVAWNAVLSLDPDNAEALGELRQAGELYKKQRAGQEQFEQLERAFKDGEYAAALRILYRLPPEATKERVERWKGNGWYNLALVSMKAGDCRQALAHLDEALAARPQDDGAARVRALAQTYLEAPKDRSYFAQTETLPFRELDE